MYYEEYKLTQNYQDLVRAGYSDDEIYNAFRIKSGDVHDKYQEYKATDNYKQLVDAGYNDGQILSAFNQKWEQRERTPRETSIEAAEAQVRESQRVYAPEERPVEISDIREDFKPTTKIEPIEDQLYRSISQAETGPYTNKWIRNEVDEASSAYGPAQITYSLARDYLSKKKDLFTAEEQAYLNKFVEQGKKFINKGTGKYALGGSGDLTSEEDKKLYESVAKKMLVDHYNNAGQDLDKTWNMWRFGPKGGTDERYRKEFMAEMEKAGKEVGRSYLEDQAVAEELFAGEGKDIVETKPVPEKEKGILDRFSANVGIAVGGVIQKIFGSEVEAAERFYDAKETYNKIGEEGFVKRLGIYFPTKETKEKYSADEIAKAGYYLEERKNEDIYAQVLPESQALVEAGKEVVAEELTNLIDTYEQSAERAMNGFVSRAWTRGDLTDAIEQGILIAVNSGATEEANKLIDLRKEITEQLAGDPDANFIERTGDALIGMIPFMGKRAAYSMIPVVGTGLAAGASAAQGGGGVYADLIEAGADEEIAKAAANIAGVAYSAVEKMQLDELTTLSKGGVDQVKKGILAKIVDFAKQRGLSALKEATEESVQAIITEGTVETIKEVEGLDNATVLERIGSVASQAAQEGIQSLATFGLLETVKGAGGAIIAKPTTEQEIAQDVQVKEETVEGQPSPIVEEAVQVVEEQAEEQLVEPQTDAAEELRQKLLDTVLTDEEKQIIAEARTQKAQEDALEAQEAPTTEEVVTEVVKEPKEAQIVSEEVTDKERDVVVPEEETAPLPDERVVVEEERVEKEEKRESKRKKINKERKERETEEREQREEVVLKDSARSTIVRTDDGITKTFKATKKQPAKVADLIDNEIKGYDRAGDIAPKVTTRTEDGYVMEDIGDNAITPETLSDKDIEDIAVVVNKLHEERGVSHGDLHLGDGKNPSNIYRDNDGNIRVLDFERASFAEDNDFDVDVAEELRDFVDTVVPEDKREKFIEAYGRDLFETRMASIEEEADVAEKVAEKPVEPRKDVKPTKVIPKEEIELRKPLMASFTKSVSAIPGVKIDKAELDQGRLVAQVVVPTETGTETKSIIIPDDIAGNKKEIKELIEEEKSKTKAPEITTEFTKEQEAVILSKVAENFGAKKPFGRGDKRRKEIESMSRADFKNYLSETKRLGESINILSDQAIDKLQTIAADYGKSALARLNKKDVFEATDMDIREYGRTEEKLTELNKITEEGSIEYNPENEDHKRWVKSKVVDTQVTSDLSVKQMSDAVAKMSDQDFSEEQIQTMIDISQGESVSYVPRIHDKLVENGLVSVELLEGTAKAKGSSETRFATTKRGLEVGAGAVAKATSLDVTGDLAKFSQEGEDEANIDYTEVDIRDVPQEDEAGDIVSQSIGEVSSSWGLFNRKGVGKGEEQKVELPRLRRPTGVDGTKTVSRNRIESAYNLLLNGFTKEELENYGVPAVLYDGSLPDKYAIPNEMLWRMNQLAQSLPESTFSKEAIEEQINKLGYFEGFYTSQSAKADKKHINKIVNDLKTSNDPRKMTMGTFIEGIVNATNISNFNLSVEALDGAMGFYSAIDNSIIVDETIDGALALSHEIGHWAYNNLLSIKEKRELLVWFKNTYMDKDGDLNVRKLADTFPSLDMAGENVFDNINEVFAEMFSQYIIKDKLPQQIAKQTKSIFDKVKNLFKYVWETLKGTKAIDPMFRQYIDLTLARAASEEELTELSEMGTVQEYVFQNPVNAKGKKEKEAVGWSDGKDRKARRENAIANAVIEQSIAELDKHIEEGKELTVDQLRNHFIDFIVYNMPEGPIRKNMLKTVMSIKSPDPKDPAYKHAVKVVKRYEEAIQRDELMKGIRKMLKPSKYVKLLSEGRKFVQDIVDNYDLQKMRAATREKMASNAWSLFNNDPKMADTEELRKHAEQQARLMKMPLRDVPLTTLREIHDELQEVYASDKAEKKAIKEGKVRSRLEAEQELVNELNSKPEQMTEEQLKAERGVTKVYSRRFKELFKRGLSTFANAETTINLLDSGNKGGFYNNVMLPVVRGANEALRYSQQATDSMVKYLKETGVNITNWSEHQHSGLANVGYKKQVLRDTHILSGRGVQLTKMEQVALLRTLGDEDGLRHVINGGIVVKIGKDRVDLKPNIRELNTFLQNADEDIITVAGAFDKYYLDEGHYLDNFVRETTGGSVDVKEKHQPLIVADARVNKESAEFMSLHEINNRMKTRTFKKGSTKERVKSSKGAIVIEDMLATQQRTAHEAGTFVGYSTTVPFVENVLKGVSKDMEKHGLKVEHQLLTNWINQIGAPDPVTQVSPNVSKAYNTMRKMFITGALGFKASTSLIQTVSAGNYLAMVDDMGVRNTLSRSIPRFVAQNMAAYTANIKDDSELNEEMFKHSPVIRERFESSNIDRDIGETGNQANTRRVLNQLVDKTASRKVKDVLNLNTPMAPISFMDKVAIKSIWDAAKMEANITGHAGDMDWVADRAEEVIRVTQPTFSTMDKPEILRNAVLKELTMFASQRSKYVNMTYRALGKISRGDTAQGVADLLWIGIAVPVAINSIKEAFNAFRGTGEEDEDIATWLVKKIIDSNSSNFAVVGDVISSIINERRLKPGGALAGQMTALSDYAQALSSGDSDRIFTSAVRTAKAFGLPAGIVEVGEILENMNE